MAWGLKQIYGQMVDVENEADFLLMSEDGVGG